LTDASVEPLCAGSVGCGSECARLEPGDCLGDSSNSVRASRFASRAQSEPCNFHSFNPSAPIGSLGVASEQWHWIIGTWIGQRPIHVRLNPFWVQPPAPEPCQVVGRREASGTAQPLAVKRAKCRPTQESFQAFGTFRHAIAM